MSGDDPEGWIPATDRMVSLVANTGMTWRAAAMMTLPDQRVAEIAAYILRCEHGEGQAPMRKPAKR